MKTVMDEFVANEMKISNDKENNRFRVYDLKAGAFRPDAEELFLSSAGDVLMTRDGRRLSLKENVILRCTGERDMKGRLIYHGDILRTDEAGWKAAVVWGYGQFLLEDDHGGFSSDPNWERCEIIGDIFSMRFQRALGLSPEEELARKFWYACWKGEPDILAELLPSCKKFVNRNLEFTECGEPKTLCLPLIAALNYGSLRCVELLLENGAKPHKRCKNTGETPWAFAKRIEAERPPFLETMATAGKKPKR